MDLAHTLAGWRRTLHERVFDRARAATFARFLWRRFLDDRLFDAAASLSYTTAFALVPLAVVVLGVKSAFPVFQQWSAELACQKSIPLGRLGSPAEAARAIFYLATPLSSYTTGSHIDVSGGLSRHA